MIKIENILILAVIISLILPLNYNTLKLVNGEMKLDSTIVMYDKTTSKNPFLTDSKKTILKPKVDVSIEGTPNDDQIKGGGGEDKINGEDGYDTLAGGKGNDKINGGKGDDIINGEFGNDTLKGDNGDDKISGESGNDLIQGGKGHDKVLAGKGDDGILGDEGSDVLNGGEGVDIMAGGTGNDTFICDLFDTMVDFNLNEGDKIVGQCNSLDQTEIETSSVNIPQEDFQSTSPPPPQSPLSPQFNHKNIPTGDFAPGPQSPPPPTVSHDNISPENFRSSPPFPIPQSNEKFISGFYLK